MGTLVVVCLGLLIFLFLVSKPLVRWLVRKSAEEELKLIEKKCKQYPNTDLYSGELVNDSKMLEEAVFTRDEKYLLAECSQAQFDEVDKKRYPLKLGYFKKEGWTGGLPFYLFRCLGCSNFAVAYKSGYGPSLWCPNCKISNSFREFEGASPVS